MRNALLYRVGIVAVVAVVAGFIGCATSAPGGVGTSTTQAPPADAVVYVQGLVCPT